jgi:hypothetical protein
MRKIFLLAALLILTQAVFAQENNDNTNVTVDQAKENSKGILKQLFMFKMAADVLETRQLISDNDLGDSIENHMTNYDNALFFKSTLEYDFFWNSVLGRKKYKVPSSKIFLESKDKYLANNVVNTSIDFDIVLTPQWENPATEDKLKDYTIEITPKNYVNLDFSESDKVKFKNTLNSRFSTNVSTPKLAPVSEAVFDGLENLRTLLTKSTLSPSDILEIQFSKKFVPNNNEDKFKLDFNLKETNLADIKKVSLEIYKKVGDENIVLHKSNDITDLENIKYFEWDGKKKSDGETEEVNYVTYADNPLFAKVIASEGEGGNNYTLEGEFKVKGNLVELSCLSFFEIEEDSSPFEIEYNIDNSKDEVKFVAGKVVITDKNGDKIDEIELAKSGDVLESNSIEWDAKGFKDKLKCENSPLNFELIASTDTEFKDNYTDIRASHLNPLKIVNKTEDGVFAPGIKNSVNKELKIEYELKSIDGIDLSNAKIQIVDKNNNLIIESLSGFSVEKKKINWDGKKSDNSFILNDDCDFKIQLVAGRDNKFVAEVAGNVDPDAESWRDFKYKDDWRTFDEYKEIKELYIDEFEELEIETDDPLKYITDNYVDAEFLGREITVNKRFLYVLRHIEEQMGRGVDGNSNSNSYSDYKTLFSEISSDARMSTINTSAGQVLSNHSLGFAIDFDATKNPMIGSVNMYLFNWIVSDLYLYGIRSDKEKMKSAHDLFKERVIDKAISISDIQLIFSEITDYENNTTYYQIKDLINNPIGVDLENMVNTLKELMEEPEENYLEIIEKSEEYWTLTNDIGQKILKLKEILPKYNKGLFLEYQSKESYEGAILYLSDMEGQTLKTLEWLKEIFDYYEGNSLEQWLVRVQDFFLGKTNEINTAYNCTVLNGLIERLSSIENKIKNEKSTNTSFKTFGNNLKLDIENAGPVTGNKLFDFGYFALSLEIVSKVYTDNEYTYWGGLYKTNHDWMHFEIRESNQKRLIELTDKNIDDYLKKFE